MECSNKQRSKIIEELHVIDKYCGERFSHHSELGG